MYGITSNFSIVAMFVDFRHYSTYIRIDVWYNPPIAPTVVDIMMILSVKVLISMKYENNISGAAFCTVISSAQFSHLNPSKTPGNHQWKGAAPLFNRRGVQMIIGVYEFLSNVNKSSVNVFITTMNSMTVTVINFVYLHSEMGRAVQLVETLCHKTGGSVFDYR